MRLTELSSNQLGGYRTAHRFKHFAAFRSVEDYGALVGEARVCDLPVYILGNGSNTWFARREIRTAVLKNELPEGIELLAENNGRTTVRVSSSTPLIKILRFCEKRGLDSFYFLASVPGNVGGALAMNAGGPAGAPTIYDFLDRLNVWEAGAMRELQKDEILLQHRHTPFTGQHAKLITSAQFTFRRKNYDESPISKRINWYKTHQDTSGPSLGSVFADGNGYVFGALKRLRFGCLGTHWSGKWGNWIVCERGSLFGIRVCIWVAVMLHQAIGRRIQLEIIKVR